MISPEPAPSFLDPGIDGAARDRDFMVRSEERLQVSTYRAPTGVARLEKFLVTETRTITVEVTHEEVRLVQDPVDDGDAVPPYREADQKNHARWMYVSREEVVVTKRVVPVERVRLEVFQVTEQRQVTESVRKEQIDAST